MPSETAQEQATAWLSRKSFHGELHVRMGPSIAIIDACVDDQASDPTR